MRLTELTNGFYELDERAAYDTELKNLPKKAFNKLGQLEDIEERLLKYKDIGVYGLIDLFKNLTDVDIEYIVQLALKKRKIIYDIR